VTAQRVELMVSSLFGPVQQMFNAVPSAPEKVSEEGAQFGHAERHLPNWSFFSPCAQNGQYSRSPLLPEPAETRSQARFGKLCASASTRRCWRSGHAPAATPASNPIDVSP